MQFRFFGRGINAGRLPTFAIRKQENKFPDRIQNSSPRKMGCKNNILLKLSVAHKINFEMLNLFELVLPRLKKSSWLFRSDLTLLIYLAFFYWLEGGIFVNEGGLTI